jgi:hypothetical protein
LPIGSQLGAATNAGVRSGYGVADRNVLRFATPE